MRQELAKNETPKLWCILGDCTDDVTCYEKAWELSNHKSARAQRDWAFYFYRKKQVSYCCFKSLNLEFLIDEFTDLYFSWKSVYHIFNCL